MSQQNAPILVTIAVVGGTGKEGSGLAKRWAVSGYRVIIGSRDAERAQQIHAHWTEEAAKAGIDVTGFDPQAAFVLRLMTL